MSAKKPNPHLTRQSDVSDINPQRFSREMVIGDHWDQTSLTSRPTKNTTPNRCYGCNNRLPKARYIVDNQQALCSDCIDSDGLHAQLWPDCRSAWHQPLDHLTDIRFNGVTVL